MKRTLFDAIDNQAREILAMADSIFDNPELAFEEWEAHRLLTDFLEHAGFHVERGLGSLPTAFRATYSNGIGGPSIGLLCEYDALPGIGHACAHHMQGPAIVAAAKAVKDQSLGQPFSLVIYGTPGEEGGGGKVKLLEEGFLEDIEVALMMHGGPATQTDVKSLAAATVEVVFHGISAHAALRPEAGRSALDALLLTFQGVEFLREHVPDDARMHYTVVDGGGAANVVPERASGSFSLRSYSSFTLDEIMRRFEGIVRGASMMTETTFEIIVKKRLEAKTPVPTLNSLLMKNAEATGAPNIRPPRDKTGSSDFGNVMRRIPGSCIRVAFVNENAASHSSEYIVDGKSDRGHAAVLYGAKILAGATYDIITDSSLLRDIQAEFKENQRRLSEQAR